MAASNSNTTTAPIMRSAEKVSGSAPPSAYFVAMKPVLHSTTKIAGALSIGATFWVLELVGYRAEHGAVNTPEAIHNLELVYLIGPVVCVMIGGLCMIGYRLGAEQHAEIRRRLDERDALYDEHGILEPLTAEPAVPTEPGRR